MSETALSITLFLHVTFIAIWVGSQVLTAAAVVPSVQRIEQGAVRLDTLEVFARKFNHIAWGAVLIIIITGGIMIDTRIDDVKAIAGGDSIFDLRWGFIFAIKMSIFIVMLGVVALHSFVFGPRLLDLNRQALRDDGAAMQTNLQTLRRKSIALSGLGLGLSVLVLGAGVFLANHGYSFILA
jgi:putative copper export protein